MHIIEISTYISVYLCRETEQGVNKPGHRRLTLIHFLSSASVHTHEYASMCTLY